MLPVAEHGPHGARSALSPPTVSRTRAARGRRRSSGPGARSAGAAEVVSINETLNLRHAELLAHVDIFARLDRVALARLAAHVEALAVPAGAEVCREGEAGDSLYVVARGSFGVYARPADDAAEARLATLTAGDCFGEMALLTQQPRSATVRADEDAEVLELAHDRLVALIRQEPAIGMAIAATLSRRLKAASEEVARGSRAIVAAIEQELLRLPPERRAHCLRAGVLDEVSPAALRALFGAEAGQVAADLASLGVAPDLPTSGPCLQALRTIDEREQGPGRAETLDRAAAARLADAGCWNEALASLARQADRAGFVGLLGRALRAAPPLAFDRARPWLERLTDEEAAGDAALALARVALHDARGHPALAMAVLQRALGAAIGGGDADGGRRLSAELARRLGADERPPSAAFGQRLAGLVGHVPSVGKLKRPPLPAFTAVSVAIGLTVLAVALRGDPRWAFGLLLLAALVLWVSDVYPDFAVLLALVAAWLALGIARPAQALGGFASSNWLFTFGVLGIAAASAESGLLFRAGLLLVRRMPPGLFLQAGTLLLTGLVLSPLLPQNAGRVALLSPIALAVAEAAKLKDREPAAAVLGLAAWIGSTPLMFWFLNGSSLCLLAWGLLPDAERRQFGWIRWFLTAAPLGVFVSLGALVMLFLLLRPRRLPPPERERVDVQIAVLGPPSRREYAMLVVLALTVAGFALAIAALNLVVRLALSQNQAILLMGLSLIPVAANLGINPWIVVISLLSTSVMWFLPNQTNSYLVALSASEERLFSPAQGRLVAFGYSAVTLLGLAVSVPFWHLLGLL